MTDVTEDTMSEIDDARARLAAAWPDGLPNGLHQRLLRAASDAERAALLAEFTRMGERRLARLAVDLEDGA